jgi:hypothetical protein
LRENLFKKLSLYMKKWGLFFLFYFLIFSVNAKKLHYPLEIIAGKADLIVTGRIIEVQENTYTFKVSETIKGAAGMIITVEKFEEWSCDIRFAKHQKGQELFLFLQKNKNNWIIIDGGNGEIPIMNQKIKLTNPTAYSVSNPNPVFSLASFKTGIRLFCQYFQLIQKGKDNTRFSYSFRTMVSHEKISSFKLNSPFSNWLANQMKKYELV